MASDNRLPLLKFDRLSKRFGQRQVINELDFELHSGEIVGLLGPNGAGKTTTLRIAAGHTWPSSGEVWLHQQRFNPGCSQMRSHIGYLPERVPLYDAFSVHQQLEFVAAARGLNREQIAAAVAAQLSNFSLETVADRLIQRLSKGYRQRVGLAQTLLGSPSVVLLDEPTNGLDPLQIIAARDMIRTAAVGRAMVISTHIVQEIEALCSRAVYLDRGKLINLDLSSGAGGLEQRLVEAIAARAENAMPA